jgi:elongator complex protein 1
VLPITETYANYRIAKVVLTEYIFSISRGSLTPPNDHGAVAVIDGETLKITPFRTANMPPPMALFDVDVKSAISDVEFSTDNSYMAILHQKGIDLYRWQLKSQRSVRPSFQSSIAFENGEIPLQISVDNDGTIYVLCFGDQHEIHSYTSDSSSGQISAKTRTKAGSIFGFAGYAEGIDGVVTQDSHRMFRQVHDGQDKLLPLKALVQLPWCTLVSSDSEGTPVALGLSKNGHLYADKRLLVKNCTSYLVTPDHLIFTTTNHLIKFVHRTQVEGKIVR